MNYATFLPGINIYKVQPKLNMKKISFLLLSIGLLSGVSFAQKITPDKVPAEVLKSFSARFPDAEYVRWEMEDKNNFEANFKSDNTPKSSTFDSSGKWMETEVEINASEL